MPISELDKELVDRYLDEVLKPTEKELFETRRADMNFDTYLQEQRLIREVLEEKGRAHLKSSLINLESKIDNKPKVVSFYSQYRNWIVAAAAAVLITVVVIGRWNTPDSNSIFQSYYTSYPNLVDPLTKGDVGKVSPYQLYEQGAYLEAITSLQKESFSQDQQWYLALSYFGTGNYEAAGEQLVEIISNTKHKYYEAAQWYTALLYVKDNEKLKSKELLLDIEQKTDHPYAAKARRLLKDL